MLFDEEEPVAAPSHVAVNDAVAGQLDRHAGAIAISLDIGDGDLVIFGQRDRDIADWGLQRCTPGEMRPR